MKRISVVVSQGQSNNPAKRDLEEGIVAALLFESGIDVTVIPNLYDLKPDGTGVLALQGIKGDMIVLAWLYPRAAHWILDRHGVHGHVGETLLVADEDDEEDADEELEAESKPRVVEHREIPNRKIYCLDLKVRSAVQPFVDEIKRVAAEATTQVVGLMDWIEGTPKPEQLQRYVQPTNGHAPVNGNGRSPAAGNGSAGEPVSGGAPGEASQSPPAAVTTIEDGGPRRWYPVIDFSRCTNCMECIDFCLFGVYGVDRAETILVEQPDNCRKGCPACSRVCPENAIIFPQHKSPAIAGSPEAAGGLKIDLSQLFGAPESGKSAEEIAVLERDEQLLMAGRQAVGTTVGMPKRQANKPTEPKDELDDLLDSLDQLDL